MANRFDWNALEDKINLAMREDDYLSGNRSKALCAVAVSTILDIDMEEAIDSITDGGNDRGIDAVFIDNREGRNDIHLFQTKCVLDFNKSQNNFPGSEVDKTISFVSDLTDRRMDAFDKANPRLKQKINDALAVLNEVKATIKIHFVGNMEAILQDELNRLSNAFKKYVAVSSKMHDLNMLADYFLEKRAPSLDKELKVVDTNFFERTDLNLKGLVCTVAASDIVELIRSESDPSKVEFGMFDQNVRVYLKKNNRINKKIIASAIAEDNHMFWYQNNGITMTCDRMQISPLRRSPSIELKNAQIVNGGQTSNCLFEAAKINSRKVEDILLLVRIIETDSEIVKLSIAESTNSQTPINVRDLRANDRQQRQLQEIFSGMGYFYERKAKQFDGKPKNKRVDALSAGQAYLAYGIGLPEVAKKDKGRVFGDLYETVFTEDLEASHLLVSLQLQNLISDKKTIMRKKIREKEALIGGDISLMEGAFHILFALRKILERDGLDVWNYKEGEKHLDEAIGLIYEIYQVAEKKEVNFSPGRFFKDGLTKDLVIKSVG